MSLWGPFFSFLYLSVYLFYVPTPVSTFLLLSPFSPTPPSSAPQRGRSSAGKSTKSVPLPCLRQDQGPPLCAYPEQGISSQRIGSAKSVHASELDPGLGPTLIQTTTEAIWMWAWDTNKQSMVSAFRLLTWFPVLTSFVMDCDLEVQGEIKYFPPLCCFWSERLITPTENFLRMCVSDTSFYFFVVVSLIYNPYAVWFTYINV